MKYPGLLLSLILFLSCQKENSPEVVSTTKAVTVVDTALVDSVPAKAEPPIDSTVIEDSLSTEELTSLFDAVDNRTLTKEERISLARFDSLGYAYDSTSLYRLVESGRDTIWIHGQIVLQGPLVLRNKENLYFIGVDSTAAFVFAGAQQADRFVILEYCRNILFKNLRTFHTGKLGYRQDYYLHKSGKIRIENCRSIGVDMVESWHCSVSRSGFNKELHITKSICAITENSFRRKTVLSLDRESQAEFSKNSFADASPVVTIGEETHTLVRYKKSRKKGKPTFDENRYYALVERQELGENRLRRTVGEGQFYTDKETDIPVTYDIEWDRDKVFSTVDNRDSALFITVDELDGISAKEYSSAEWTPYLIGEVANGSLKGGILYAIWYEEHHKEGPGESFFLSAVKKGKTLYVEQGREAEYTLQPPFEHTIHCTERCAQWSGLEESVLFTGIEKLELCYMAFEGFQTLPDTIELEFLSLVKRKTYITDELITGDTVGYFQQMPIIQIDSSENYGDSSFVYNTQAKQLRRYLIQEPSGVVAEYRWDIIERSLLSFYDGLEPDTSNGDYLPFREKNGWVGKRYVFQSDNVLDTSLISSGDLMRIGTVSKYQESVYGLKDKNHWLYKELYEHFKSQWRGPNPYFKGDSVSLLSYEEFVNSVPLLIWKDYFGVYICFLSRKYVPQVMAEPIVYLYNDAPLDVTIEIDPKVTIRAALPKLQNRRWDIFITGKGALKDAEGHFHDKLFWEGESYSYPDPNSGFVCSRNGLAQKLDSTLTYQGLNEKECNDFIVAWKEDMSVKPYVQFWFYTKELIDEYAPLHVSPKPDTEIRVMMGWKPLDDSVAVQPQELRRPPKRRGFTLVEWGGLER